MERLDNTKLFIVLVGEQTKFLYKFVRWEIEQALSQNLPIIVININGKREIDKDRCPPILIDKLALHISFNQKIIEKAIAEWISLDKELREKNDLTPRWYKADLYTQLGL